MKKSYLSFHRGPISLNSISNKSGLEFSFLQTTKSQSHDRRNFYLQKLVNYFSFLKRDKIKYYTDLDSLQQKITISKTELMNALMVMQYEGYLDFTIKESERISFFF